MAMANVTDIDLTDELELKIENGDFKIADSDQNHILLITQAYVGAFKQFPLVGVGSIKFLASTGQQQILRRNIAVQLEADNYEKVAVVFTGESIYEIDAQRIPVE